MQTSLIILNKLWNNSIKTRNGQTFKLFYFLSYACEALLQYYFPVGQKRIQLTLETVRFGGCNEYGLNSYFHVRLGFGLFYSLLKLRKRSKKQINSQINKNKSFQNNGSRNEPVCFRKRSHILHVTDAFRGILSKSLWLI